VAVGKGVGITVRLPLCARRALSPAKVSLGLRCVSYSSISSVFDRSE